MTEGETKNASAAGDGEGAAEAPIAAREILFTRFIPAPRAIVYRCWTEPELMKAWFTPRPWTTPVIEIDVRAGGKSFIIMRSPEGTDHPQHGVYLDAVANERLVFTDAFTEAWVPSTKPFMTADVTFTDEAGGSRYTARILHWSVADREHHEAMGFHTGWGLAADQLAALARSL